MIRKHRDLCKAIRNFENSSVTFFDVSLVKCPEMQSQWQAGFMGIFPANCLSLPATHPSDKEFFEKHWKGDNYTTYEQFINKGKKC